jgi:hypothetical protein
VNAAGLGQLIQCDAQLGAARADGGAEKRILLRCLRCGGGVQAWLLVMASVLVLKIFL